MKIEMGESLFYSWLRHVKDCQIVQTNWTTSKKWDLQHQEELERLMQESAAYFLENAGYNIYKHTVSLSQLLQQAECDAIGISMNADGNRVYAVDVAFHEGGLNYGSKETTTTKIIAKSLRTAMCIYGYLDMKEAEIIFASPKIHNAELALIRPCFEAMQKFIFGVVVGDALGCPVQFEGREKVATHPVTGMRGYGSFNLPAGSWTDDSSLTLALLDSIGRNGKMNLNKIMLNFVDWLEHGAFTPYGYSYDIGFGTESAILAYERSGDPLTCGGRSEENNGNGSLMRIMPACLYCCSKNFDEDKAITAIHAVGGLTHAHIRANIACGLYWFITRAILNGAGTLAQRMQQGLDEGFRFYERTLGEDLRELAYYDRIRDLQQFAQTPAEDIQGSGYVVETLEAVVWALITTDSFEEALLKVVNLGRDTDTTGAIAGGLAALYYGFDAIPADWLMEIKKKDWIEELCDRAEQAVNG